jgi:hypothetical protein
MPEPKRSEVKTSGELVNNRLEYEYPASFHFIFIIVFVHYGYWSELNINNKAPLQIITKFDQQRICPETEGGHQHELGCKPRRIC